ncbi:MAG: GDSL-type esterase/lipase family protein [Bryobacteraceae bacterium]
MRAALWLALAAFTAPAQERALLANAEIAPACARIVQLMESTGAVVPALARAAAPVIENARQALSNFRAGVVPIQDSIAHHEFLRNLRAFLSLADALPKPHPFPQEGHRQFQELRERADRLETHFRALLEFKEAQIRNADRDNLRRYAEANERLAPPDPRRGRVVFLGDSITDGWRLNEYFPERDFVNRGIGGQITGQMLGRMKADVLDNRPAAVLILAGTNDIARGVPLEAIRNNLVMMADLAVAHQIKPIFAALLPIHDYHKDRSPGYLRSQQRPPQTIRALNEWIADFCKKRNFGHVDYFGAVVDDAGFLKGDLADDGLHPNPAGYRLMAPLALAAIDAALAPPAPKQGKKKR